MTSWLALAGLGCAMLAPLPLQAQEIVDFARDIRPLLADHCFTCHGPDAATREGGFRLDVRESAFAEADSGEIPIVPGDVLASELLRRVKSDDESEQMPPPDAKKRPADQQIELLERWIAEGASWQQHWAFVEPEQPAPPVVERTDWPLNPIDQFVLAKLREQGIEPSSEADQITLVRRLFLDLTGLPPDATQLESWLDNDSPDCYDDLVEYLLDSPHYGEQMAIAWLDGARFADTNGYQNDFRRSMWLYRDWVIDAFNDNMPFDQFTIEQIAGDMLPDATVSQKVASGFNRNHRSNTEGGSINEEWLVENVVDRVETTSTVFLGLTMGCARCHDHKYDPVTQREFYEFFAYFNNIDERGVYTEKRGNAGPVVAVETPEYQQRARELREALGSVQRAQALRQREAMEQQAQWEEDIVGYSDSQVPGGSAVAVLGRAGETMPESVRELMEQLDPGRTNDELPGPAVRITGTADHVVLGDAFDFDATRDYTVSAWVRPTSYGAILSRMDEQNAYRGFDMLIMPDGRMNVHLIHNWPGNATKITTVPRIPLNQWTHVAVRCAAPGKAVDIQVFLNGTPAGHTVDTDTLDGTTLTDHPVWLGLRARTPPFAGKISSLRIWPRQLDNQEVSNLHHGTVQHMVRSTGKKRTEQQQTDIDYQYLIMCGASPEQNAELIKLRREMQELKAYLPTTMVMQERDQRRPAFVLQRGQYDRPDESQPVDPGVPSIFASMPGEPPADRLELARWLVAEDNPLTARVIVNRFWARYFNAGLLETSENFGIQSPLPSHPELLDWLATEFVRSGWDIKHMQRLIVTSATYRQASLGTPESFRTDPQNRLLARGPRFRLPAESIRDNALAISGLLNPDIGGPSIKPYQPAGLWEELAGGAKEPPYEQATDNNLYRRSLYIYRKRTVPHPAMSTFDAPSWEVCTVGRSRTNTPLQALALLNDPTYVEAARHLAMRAIDRESTAEEQLRFAFRRATCRWPTEQESSVLLASLKKYHEHFTSSPADADRYLAVGQSNADDKYDKIQLAALATVCSVILNLDEVITKE